MSTSPGKSLWLRRYDELMSLSLAAIAAELNERRLRRLREQSDRPVARLPADRRASPRRMHAALVALHQILTNDRSRILKIETIAARMGSSVSEATARRAILELEEASLIAVTRRERDHRTGGQGPSEYLIVWPTIRDLALTQGLQPSLFDDGNDACDRQATNFVKHESVNGAESVPLRPVELTGRTSAEGSPREDSAELADLPGAPSQNGRAPSQNGRAPSQNGRAPSQNGRAYSRRVRARSPFPLSTSSLLLLSHPEEEEVWSNRVGKELAACGLDDVRTTIALAIEHGWTAWQALELIDTWRRRSVALDDGTIVRAWGSGVLWWQLRNGQPGSRITLQESEAYRREVAARERRRERARRAESASRDQAESQDRLAGLEAAHGAALDAMTAEEQETLLLGMGPIVIRRFRQVGLAGMRPTLLLAIAKRQSELPTGGDDDSTGQSRADQAAGGTAAPVRGSPGEALPTLQEAAERPPLA